MDVSKLVPGGGNMMMEYKEIGNIQSSAGTITLPPVPAHIGVVVKDIDKAIQFFRSTYDTGRVLVVGEYSAHKEDLIVGDPFKLKIALIELGTMTFELLQPVGKQISLWSQFLESNGDGLHHIAYRVSNVDEIISKFKKLGIGVIIRGYYRKESGNWVYMNTGTNPSGIIIEFVDFSLW